MNDKNELKAQAESLTNKQVVPVDKLPEEILSLSLEEKRELLRLWEEHKG